MGTAFLDLQRMAVEPEAGLKDVGPCACLAGDLERVPWQFGSSSQAWQTQPLLVVCILL